MTAPAIQIDNLSKRYRIGSHLLGYRTLRESVSELASAPFRFLFNPQSSIRTPRFIHHPFSRNDRAAAKAPQPRAENPSSSTAADHIWAIKGVSLDVAPGEVVGIIGRNGAGKSTLLKVLSRITEPTSGRVRLKGRVASLLEVGTGFHPELTGRENIFLSGAILGMSRSEIRRQFDAIVAFADTEQFVDTPVKRYSSGMGVRLAFAVAAHLEPEILLIDEVLAVGDAHFQKKCMGKMDTVAKQGRTVLIVSHNMFTVQNLCTRAVLLQAGQVHTEGDVSAVVKDYLQLCRDQAAEVSWDCPENAPGNHRLRLKAIRVVSEGRVSQDVDISKPFQIEVDYWNLEPNARRMVSIHLHNSAGICVLTSGNLPSVSLTPDPWSSARYPRGLFRTTCAIPGSLLNDGTHTVSLYIHGSAVKDTIILMRDVLGFNVQDSGAMRQEYTGPWLGAVRPRLAWNTAKVA